MQKICYVKFDSSDKEYSYFCGHLDPKPGTKVIVQTRDGKLKIVSCTSLADSTDSWTNQPIFATITTQQDAENADSKTS